MEFIKVFIITQLIFLLFQFVYPLKLETYQYTELVLGSFLMIVFFGLFGFALTLDMNSIDRTSLFASLFAIWFYITKKLSNSINSDANGVIYY
jgi:hypothetical protein